MGADVGHAQEGRVTCLDPNSHPVGKRHKTGTTDADGNFSISRLEYDTYELHVQHPDYCPRSSKTLQVGRAQTPPLTLSLLEGTRLTGVCTCASQDDGTFQIRFSALRYQGIYSSTKLLTKADGSFRFDSLVPPGKYTISAARTNVESPFDALFDIKSSKIEIVVPRNQPTMHVNLTLATPSTNDKPLDN